MLSFSQGLQRGLEILHRHQDELEITAEPGRILVTADTFYLKLQGRAALDELLSIEGWTASPDILHCFEFHL